MQTKYYTVKNVEKFSGQSESMEKLNEYLRCIEEIAFPTIEEVFGRTWEENQINIILDNSSGGARYYHDGCNHIVEMGINNKNIGREYPENLWGCLFHETHHAFLYPVNHNKRDGKILNGGHKDEVFNYAFMATTYLKLKEKTKIDKSAYESFLAKLEKELGNQDAIDIYHEYVDIFSKDIKNFAKFISYVESSNSVFTNLNNFRQDLNKAKVYLQKKPILK